MIIFNLALLGACRRIRFYVTSQRIVKATDWIVLKRLFQLPLKSITDMKAWQARGRGYVLFIPHPPDVQVLLGPFKDNPERVRQIALEAQSTTN
jgi:hypothetical protein